MIRNGVDKRDIDAVVVGAGPNGLAAAIALQQAGRSVVVFEAKSTVGGGMRTAELTLPGFRHDICSAIHPLGAGSPFLNTLPLHRYGLEYIYPPVAAAHPFADGTVALLQASIAATAQTLGPDAGAYERLMPGLVANWPTIAAAFLGPLRPDLNLLKVAKFGAYALLPAQTLANWQFSGKRARGLLAGMAAHSLLPLDQLATSAVGLVLTILGHAKGWPLPKGGSQRIANALAAYFTSIGGRIETNVEVTSLSQLPSARAVLFDVTPRQLLKIAGHAFSPLYRWQLERFRYGAGVFKVDYALDGPVPFTAPECGRAGTVHLGNTLAEIAAGEKAVHRGQHPDRPFVLLAQQSLFDDTRAPAGKHTAWAYCHVPNGSRQDMTATIEGQIERFAPGFRDRILGRHVMNTGDLEAYNANYCGGDINGGRQDLGQIFTRPALRWSPYKTSAKGLYICSSSTPPGGGVHGMGGYHAAQRALRDIFSVETPNQLQTEPV
ncbi:MAG: NAD(P)/FAD-dependent oxidoreductase [Bacteroidetes bacterium]|nr:NAD(P)/FAD-dependent oxidoreductase [Fibrella sp.]